MMGSDDLFRKKNKKDFERVKGLQKEYKNSILIVCEGEETEPNYFKAFPVTGVKVEVQGTGRSNISLLNESIKIWTDYANEDMFFEIIWCVFDRDSFPLIDYNQAFYDLEHKQLELNRKFSKKVKRKIKFNIAYSNEAFEIWYLLHYNYHTSGINRKRYKKMLTKRMGKEYKKNDPGMYEFLQNLTIESDKRKGQNFAILNAGKLRQNCTADNCHNQNPSTSVDILVKELNQHLKK